MKDFLISSDQYLRRWDYNRNTNDVPIVMLPSQWLSLILRYMERTENDYKSFVNFLNIKISNQHLSEEQMFSVINGISEMTSDIEQQRYLLKAYINEDLEKSLQNLDNDVIEEKAMEFAKTTLEQKIENLEKQQIDNKNDIESLKKEVLEKNQESNNKEDVIDRYKKQLDAKTKEIGDKDVKISKYELANWKRPRYWSFGVLFCISIILFVLYFWPTEWHYNFCSRFLKWVDSPDCQTQKSIAKCVWFAFHLILFVFSLCTLISLKSIDKNDDKKNWMRKSLKNTIEYMKNLF